jgi:Kef-type K+ transport system membrane component KefB
MEASLRDLALLAVTLAALVAGGWAAKRVDAPLVGEIVVGMLLGPSGLVPTLPDYAVRAVFLVGDLGLVLLVMEGGLSVDVPSLRRVGSVACLIAVAGTALPIALGTAFMVAAGFDATTGVVAGTALSSTSIGMATRLMATFGELSTPLGALVCVAAMVDDVLSLVILAIISEGLANGSDSRSSNGSKALTAATPALVSVAVVIIAAILFRTVPSAISLVKSRTSFRSDENASFDACVLASMLALTLAATVGSGAVGSTHLLGAFAGGMAFASVDGARRVWERDAAAVAAWTHSIFFLAVGFHVPLRDMFVPLKGFGLGVGYAVPAIVGKLVTGFIVGADVRKAFVVGWAMVGRGELGFVMAGSAFRNGLLDSTAYVASVWALLVATLVSPIQMRAALRRWKEKEKNDDETIEERAGSDPNDDALVVGGAEGFTAEATGAERAKNAVVV